MAISDTQQQIQQARQQVQQAKEQTENFSPRIEMSRRELMRQTPTSATRVREAERLRGIARETALQEIQQKEQAIEQYQQEFDAYVASPAGKLAYVKENNLQPVRFTTRYFGEKADDGSVRLPVYELPNGEEFVDETKYYEQLKDESKLQALELGFSSKQADRIASGNSGAIKFLNERGVELDLRTGELKVPAIENFKTIDAQTLELPVQESRKFDFNAFLKERSVPDGVTADALRLQSRANIPERATKQLFFNTSTALVSAQPQTLNSPDSIVVNELDVSTRLPDSRNILEDSRVQYSNRNRPSTNDFRTGFQARIQKEEARQINPATGRPYEVASRAPSLKEQFSKSVEDNDGFIKGSLGFLGNKLVRVFESTEVKRARAGSPDAFYQTDATANLLRTIPTAAALSNPVTATVVAIGGGTEQIIRGDNFKERAIGAVELGFGLAGAAPAVRRFVLPRTAIRETVNPLGLTNREPIIPVTANPTNRVTYIDEAGNTITASRFDFGSFGATRSIPSQAELQVSGGRVVQVFRKSPILSAFGREPKLIYEGVPFSNNKAYQEALKKIQGNRFVEDLNTGKVTSSDLTESQARELIRYQQPVAAEIQSGGIISVVKGGGKEDITLYGQSFVKPVSVSKGNIKTRKFQPFGFNVNQPADFLGQINPASGFGDEAVLIFGQTPKTEKFFLPKGSTSEIGELAFPVGSTQKLSQAGKTTSESTVLGLVQRKGEGTIFVKETIGGIEVVKQVPAEGFNVLSLTRKTPKSKITSTERSKIISVDTGDTPLDVTGTAPVRTRKIGEAAPTRDIADLSDNEIKDFVDAGQDIFGNTKLEKVELTEDIAKLQTPKVKAFDSKPLNKAEDILGSSSVPKQSEFFGKGLYERTEGISFPAQTGTELGLSFVERQPELRSTINTDLVSGLNINQNQQQNELQNNQGFNFEKVSQDISQVQNQKQNLFQNQNQNQRQNQNQNQVQNQLNLQLQNQVQNQNIFSGQLPRARQTNVVSPKTTPKNVKPVTIRTPKSPARVGRLKLLVGKVKQAYDVVTFKGGKEVTIAEGLPEGRANQLGTKKILSSLRASFKLKAKGTTTQEDIQYNIPNNLFTRSKRDPNRFVQRRETRLSSRSEVADILSAKRAKGSTRRSKKFKWF